MPRRRMLDPSFTEDIYVAKLTRDERLFLIGCLRNADDEGRLKGHPAYLKAEIFMYDEDINLARMEEIKDSTLGKMEDWPESNPWRLESYENAGGNYLYFPLWYQHQAPSHPQPSQLPAPPGGPSLIESFTDATRQEIYERDNYTCQYCGADLSSNPRTQSIDHVIPLTKGGTHQKSNLVTACKSCNLKKKNKTPEEAGMKLIPECKAIPRANSKVNHKVIPTANSKQTQVRKGQSSPDKVSIGQVRGIDEDFTAYIDSGKDLTDFLIETLKKYEPRGPHWLASVLTKVWEQGVGAKMSSPLFSFTFDAVKEYPPPVLGRAYAKAVKYKGGTHRSYKYLAKILKEEAAKERSPPE